MLHPDLVDSDDEYLMDDPADEAADLVDVDRHLAAVRRARTERDQITAIYETEIGRLTDRLESVQAVIDRRIAWHLAPVESWHRAHPQKRQLKLPHGTIKLTVPTKACAWFDGDTGRDAVTDWARREHPELLKAPNITDVRKTLELVEVESGWVALDASTGEVVDGLTVTVPEPSWSFTVEDGDSPW